MATGCYNPSYLPASFKGVSFEAMDTSSEHGRRGAEGEFPFGENTAYADMGRRIRQYSIRARFPNNGHIASAAALIAAVESRGPGTLVHPTRGIVRVGCKSLKVSDNPLEEQGVTYVDMDFVEASALGGGLRFGLSVLGFDTGPLLTVAANVFTAGYVLSNVFFHRQNIVRDHFRDTLDLAREQLNAATANEQDSTVWRALAELNFAASDDATTKSTEAAQDILFNALAAINAKSSGENKIRYMRVLANFAATVSTLPEQAGLAVNAVNSGVRIAAAAYITQATLEAKPATLAQGFEQYEIIETLLTDEAAQALSIGDTANHVLLLQQLADIQGALFDRIYNLPAIVSYNFNRPVNALVASYEIFDDAKRYGELLDANPHMSPLNMGPTILAARAN